jgi:hypothetical protein
MVGHTGSVDAHLTQLISPRYGRSLILERAHRLPAVEAGVVDRDRLFAVTQLQARQSHTRSLRASASYDGIPVGPVRHERSCSNCLDGDESEPLDCGSRRSSTGDF